MRTLIFFLAAALSYCDATLSSDRHFRFSKFSFYGPSNICVNSSTYPLFITFNDVPNETEIIFYRQTQENSGLTVDFAANIKSFPFVTRSVYNHSSFTIHSLHGGNYLIGIFTAEMCEDGIFVLTTNSKIVEFSSEDVENAFFKLTPGTRKCLAIMNSTPTTVNVSLNSTNSDMLYSYLSYSMDPIVSSGVDNFSISNKETFNLMLFAIQLADGLNTFRNVKFIISSETQQEKSRYLIYGNNDVENTKTSNKVKKIRYEWGISKNMFIYLGIAIFVFIFSSMMLFFKYHFNFYSFKYEIKNVNMDQPLLPSAFVR